MRTRRRSDAGNGFGYHTAVEADSHTTPAWRAALAGCLHGPLLLVILLIGIAAVPIGLRAMLSGAYFLVLAGMVFGRWMEQQSGAGMTAYGRPADRRHFRMYAFAVLCVAILCWTLAISLAPC